MNIYVKCSIVCTPAVDYRTAVTPDGIWLFPYHSESNDRIYERNRVKKDCFCFTLTRGKVKPQESTEVVDQFYYSVVSTTGLQMVI